MENKSLADVISLGSSETLKVLITTKEDKKPKRPHQAFLRIEDTDNHLDTSFAFTVKDNGKGKAEVVSWPVEAVIVASSLPLI